MNLGYPKEQLGNSSRLEIFCSSSPNMKFIWDSTQKTSLQLAIVIATVACRIHCPFKHRSDWNDKKVRQLQTNSNILIASLAAAGLLVGAVCMPLTISLDIHFLVWKWYLDAKTQGWECHKSHQWKEECHCHLFKKMHSYTMPCNPSLWLSQCKLSIHLEKS